MKPNQLMAYAMDFVSFLIENIDMDNISRVILFGSVARDESSRESDVDLFIDVVGDKKTSGAVEIKVKKAVDNFQKSRKYEDYWMLKGVKNDIRPIVGKLDSWKDIKNSIISNGVVLFDKFEEKPEGAVYKTMFSWENISPESKRVMLSKRLFGYKKEGKSYEGLVKKYEGERIGKGIIIVTSKNTCIFMKLFRDMGIAVKIKKMIEYK